MLQVTDILNNAKRYWRAILITLCIVVIAPVWRFFIAPTVLQISKNWSYVAKISSTDIFFDEDLGEYSDKQYSVTTFEYKVESVNSEGVVLKNLFDVRSTTGENIFKVERFYGIDRKTGEHISSLGDRERNGYLFAPRNIKKGESFTYWHVNYDGPAHMIYVGEDIIDGLNVYRYKADYTGVSIDQTQNLTYLPGVPNERGIVLDPNLELWIEPVTGYLVKYYDDTVAWYYDIKTGTRLHPWNHFSNSFTEESIIEHVSIAKDRKSITSLFFNVFPLLIVFGSLLYIALILFFPFKEKGEDLSSRVQMTLALITVLIGVAVLFGWIMKMDFLIQVLPESNGMNPVTALMFILYGCSIFLIKRNKTFFAIICLSIIVIVAGLRIGEYYSYFSFGVDLLIFKDRVLEGLHPMRMSLFTAFSFVILSLSLLSGLNMTLQKIRLASILAGFISLLASIAFIAYFLQETNLLKFPLFFSAAFHTILLILLNSFVLLWRYSDIGGKRILGINMLAIFTLIFPLILTVIIWTYSLQSVDQKLRARFEVATESVKYDLSKQLGSYINLLRGVAGLFDASRTVESNEWQKYITAQDLEKNYPRIQVVLYSKVVQSEDKNDHLYGLQVEKEKNEFSMPVVLVSPLTEENKKSIDFDVFSDEVYRLAILRARDTGLPSMSSRINLVDVNGKKYDGFAIYVPIYQQGLLTVTVEDRRRAFSGVIAGFFKMSDFIKSDFSDAFLEIDLHVYDGIYFGKDHEPFGISLETDIRDEIKPRFKKSDIIYMAGHPWTLEYHSRKSLAPNGFDRYVPIVTLVGGVLVSLLLYSIFIILSLSKIKAENYAREVTLSLRERTNELDLKNKDIEERLAEQDKLMRLMTSRELKMVELKEEIEKLKKKI